MPFSLLPAAFPALVFRPWRLRGRNRGALPPLRAAAQKNHDLVARLMKPFALPEIVKLYFACFHSLGRIPEMCRSAALLSWGEMHSYKGRQSHDLIEACGSGAPASRLIPNKKRKENTKFAKRT